MSDRRLWAWRRILAGGLGVGLLLAVMAPGRGWAADPVFPVLVPLTGFLALEGTSQRNGAMLALETLGKNLDGGASARADVADTGTSPEGAVTAMERALSRGTPPAVVASMLGVQMLALLPLADEAKVPLLTVSGTAAVTERGSPWVFRFFPGDGVTKAAHARYVVEELGHRRPALITQTTAYGQSGRHHLVQRLTALGAPPVFDESVDPASKDLSSVITRALASNPDVLVLHLHAGSSALFLRQAAALGVTLPVVAGSALHQPATAALLEPMELRGVCAESASSPVSGETSEMKAFVEAYRARFKTEPDAFAVGQYDAVAMALAAFRQGQTTPAALREALANGTFQGLAMTYRANGKGDMAHSAIILCYDGTSRVPKVVRRYGE